MAFVGESVSLHEIQTSDKILFENDARRALLQKETWLSHLIKTASFTFADSS